MWKYAKRKHVPLYEKSMIWRTLRDRGQSSFHRSMALLQLFVFSLPLLSNYSVKIIIIIHHWRYQQTFWFFCKMAILDHFSPAQHFCNVIGASWYVANTHCVLHNIQVHMLNLYINLRQLLFDNFFGAELSIWDVFKNNCLRGNIYIRLSFLFSMFSIQSQHFLVDSDAPPPFNKQQWRNVCKDLFRFRLLTFSPPF